MLFRSSAAPVLILLMFATYAHADHAPDSIGFQIDTLLPVSTTQEMCIDTQPLNDGFGWNGMCTCRLPGSYERFGNSLITDGNRVIIGSEQSPNSCVGSGTASVYQIQANGTLDKEAELVSSVRESNDAFALWNTDIALAGDYLAVGARESNKLTVFAFDGSVWNEHYVKDLDERANQFSIHSDELFALTSGTEISRFNINDGTTIQTIPLSDTCEHIRNFHVLDDLISISAWCNNNRATFIFRQNSTGQYERASRFEFNSNFQSISKVADGRSIIVRGGNGPLISRLQTATDTWTLLEPLEVRYDGFELHNGQIFVIRTTTSGIDFIRLYELDTTGTRWVQTQTLNFHNDAFVGNSTRMAFSENRLSVVRSAVNIEDSRPMNATVSVFEKGDASRWSLLFEQEFTGPKPDDAGGLTDTSSAFAGSNLFLSVMDNEVRNIRLEPGQSTNAATDNTGACDYSNADQFNGWGWNTTTQSSCPPTDAAEPVVNTNACDYSNAALNNGWGWNATTQSSCPPAETAEPAVSTNACDYSNAALNNGWGWNNETRQSCPPGEVDNMQTGIETSDCDYTDAALNGGWGWNAVTMQSCRPLTNF